MNTITPASPAHIRKRVKAHIAAYVGIYPLGATLLGELTSPGAGLATFVAALALGLCVVGFVVAMAIRAGAYDGDE